MRSLSAQARGVVGAFRSGHGDALALAVADSRTLVRSLFLASAARLDVLPFLVEPRTIDDLASRVDATRVDRLTSWLEVGVSLHELRRVGDRYVVRGRRARALADRAPVLVAHYRSMFDYQLGPYDDLAERLRDGPGEGRDDLERHATTIAEVSRAATPFILPFLRECVAAVDPVRLLDIGCGTGVYLQAMLEAAPRARGEGIDLAADVVADARARLAATDVAERAGVVAGDARDLLADRAGTYDVVTLVNNIYYFDAATRVGLYRQVRETLTSRGELVVVTMVTPGSPASAHLDFMLVVQAGHASLPTAGEIEHDLRTAGFGTVEAVKLVPGEPFVGIRARRGR